MALPRSKYVPEGKEGFYHCFCRCVRRAFLYGFDSHTGRDFSHRKAWIEDRLRELASIFAIQVSTYSVMDNHYHTTVRTRPDIVDGWSDEEVAKRWLILYPTRYRLKKTKKLSIEEQIHLLALNPERIAILRKRLSSLSWFMKQINEFIARAANKEDGVKGRFWESRFKCTALLDESAILAGMVYVDLNPVRAGVAETPEESDFTGIQQRIRERQKVKMSASADSKGTRTNKRNGFSHSDRPAESGTDERGSDEEPASSTGWLCPISSKDGRGGILPMTTDEYIDLVERSAREIRADKRNAKDADLSAILSRVGVVPEEWEETITSFCDKFHLVAGILGNMRNFASQVGNRWFKGVTAARTAFTTPPPESS